MISTYFAFTSLGTFGLGDYYPQNNIERLFISFMLLFGVAIFSYVMGNFITILNYSMSYSAGFDDGDLLSKFFGVLQNFNHNQPIDSRMRLCIEKYFDYRW